MLNDRRQKIFVDKCEPMGIERVKRRRRNLFDVDNHHILTIRERLKEQVDAPLR